MLNNTNENNLPISSMNRSWDMMKASVVATRTSNPIRNIVDQLTPKDANPEKPLLSLSIGDPTVFGNLDTHPNVIQSIEKALHSNKYNGYAPAFGYTEARAAVAKKLTEESNGLYTLKTEDVFLASGCSGALDILITALANEGENILIPTPGFSLYQTLCNSKGIECKYYQLIPEQNWEANLKEMEQLIDEKTKAILVNNPSNPCGSVYSKQHLEQILALAEKYCVPIIADEIYADMVFEGSTFYRMGHLTTKVPVFSVGGIAKQYLVPGWRLGWIVVYDYTTEQYANAIRPALFRLTTLILGPNSVVQGALHQILHDTPKEFYQQLNKTLEKQAIYCIERLKKIPGLSPISSQGAMYLMVAIDTKRFFDASHGQIFDDISFSKALLREESVVVLPGQCFRMQNYFRIVICPPVEKLEEAFNRIEEFCQRTLASQ